MAMHRFGETCDAIASTTKKLEKISLVAVYLGSLPVDEAAIAAVFLSGRPFPAFEEKTLKVGGALLWRAIGEVSGKSESELAQIYRQHGDAGAVAGEALPATSRPGFSLGEIQTRFFRIAEARGPAAKMGLVRELLEGSGREAKYIVKIITGDLRIGLKESLVEEAIARAAAAPVDEVKRANMLLGDLGATLRLAFAGKLAEAQMRLFHPIDIMLASPVETAEEAVGYFPNATVEDKYDGIRAQAHCSNGEVKLFSRTRDDITESFPELRPALAGLSKDAILDGEIVAWTKGKGDIAGRALPFTALQKRLGRKRVSAQMMNEVPLAYLAFDVIYADGKLLLDCPLRERGEILDGLLADLRAPGASRESQKAVGQIGFGFSEGEVAEAPVIRAPASLAHTAEDLELLFTAARNRGNEGLMIKDADSRYTPGRRGKSWLKMKRELATLDAVVTAVEYGHGKRIGVLSDYTFAVWGEEGLMNIGKAYSGLTDSEIAEMTKWFLEHKRSEVDLRLEVEPKIVVEVAFNNMMRSTRHESGYALRFPRIVRLRPDKAAEDADTLERVKEIYAREHATVRAEEGEVPASSAS